MSLKRVSILILLLLLSCDDRLLKKTVSVEDLHGEISYDPHHPAVFGKLKYSIKNKQSTPLSEIYLFCHPSVQVDYIAYNRQPYRYEQWLGFGYGLYRIKISELKPNQTAQLEVKFNISGTFSENRFVLTKNFVFFDAKKVWLPLPFAEIPNFPYDLSVKTPLEYQSILGAKLLSVQSNSSEQIKKWKSEINNPLITGNLLILKSKVIKDQNMTLYTDDTNMTEDLLSNSKAIVSLLKTKIGYLPFSQYHIVNHLIPYKDMETFINGEFLGNMLHISPSLLNDPLLLNLSNSIEDPNPLIMNHNYLNIVETLAHEISHSYFGGIIASDEDHQLDFEVITEFLALNIVRSLFPQKFPSMIRRNRFILINLSLHQTDNIFFDYLYGINLLQAVFSPDPDGFFELVQALLEKYRYTQIGMDEIRITTEDLNREIQSKNLQLLQTYHSELSNGITNEPHLLTPYPVEYLDLYHQKKLFNTRILLSNSLSTNLGKIKENSFLVIQNQFPIKIQGPLRLNFSDGTQTNYSILLKPDSEIRIPFSNQENLIKASFLPDSLCVEYEKDDNFFPLPDAITRTESFLSNFYNSSNSFSPNEGLKESEGWLSAEQEYQKTFGLKSKVTIKVDQVFTNQNSLFLFAYKILDQRPFSYLLFELKLKASKLMLQKVFDPTLK